MRWNGNKPKIVQGNGAVHSKQEVDHKSEFQDGIRRELFGDIPVAFPAIGKAVDVELGGSYEFASFAHMPLEDCPQNCGGKNQVLPKRR